ncbi:MAG: Ldh family oxidoreductase [Bacillota bacterium]
MTRNEGDYIRVPVDQVKSITSRLLQAHGVPGRDADVVAEVLTAADVRGVESHGIGRLIPYYLTGLEKGYIKTKPEVKAVREHGSIFVMDADNGLGHVACHRAMKKSIALAEQYGIGMGGVRNSNHFGIAGYYAMMALEEGMIGLCLCNSTPLVLPTYSKKAVLGTNPISFAAPAGKHRPFVLDMATSVVPIGKIQVHRRWEARVPPQWGADDMGRPTDDPEEILDGGGLFPLGGPAETSGYKGYGLAAVVDILSGVLTGASFLTGVCPGSAPRPSQVGQFVAALKPDAFIDPDEFAGKMDSFIDELKGAPLAEGCDRVFVAGEKEFWQTEESEREGVAVHGKVWSEIMEVARRMKVDTT